MTVRADVVDYLRENLPKYPVEVLRKQLTEEGVPEDDFQESLAEALRGPKTVPTLRTKTKSKTGGKAARILLAGGLALIVGAGLYALSQRPDTAPAPQPAANSTGESGFVGAHGWVVRLPKDYAGTSRFSESDKNTEIVHFAPRGTESTNFLNEGLFGQMGIVRLTVTPSPFPGNPTGQANLAAAVSRKTASHGEKFVVKNIQIATLPGVQVNVLAPFPRIEAYVLGANDLYFFYAGQEDDVWRDIVLSLRDAHSEN